MFSATRMRDGGPEDTEETTIYPYLYSHRPTSTYDHYDHEGAQSAAGGLDDDNSSKHY